MGNMSNIMRKVKYIYKFYKNDQLHGKSRTYYENGNLESLILILVCQHLKKV